MGRPRITVLAGTNGAGKSSIAGAAIRANQGFYFNPDEAARDILAANPGLGLEEANGHAWEQGRRLLERAITDRQDFALETTLGGRTILALLQRAAAEGFEVWVFDTGLATPDLHISRVRARVARGGHDIPEAKIRERYNESRLNLITLLPALEELRVFDNSKERDPADGLAPEPELLLHMSRGEVVEHCQLGSTPDWAKPILAAALGLQR